MKRSIARRLVGTLVACLFVTTGTVAMNAGPAFAAGCFGSGCNGLDPQGQGCSPGAATLDEFTRAGTRVELRYSSACNAAWVRFTEPPGYLLGNYGNCPDFVKLVASNGQGVTLRAYMECIPYPQDYTITGWTAMNGFGDWVSACGSFHANDNFDYCTARH
jgi:hypothetical protein